MPSSNTIQQNVRNSGNLRRIRDKNQLIDNMRGNGKEDEEQVRYNGGIYGEEKQKQRRGNKAKEEEEE